MEAPQEKQSDIFGTLSKLPPFPLFSKKKLFPLVSMSIIMTLTLNIYCDLEISPEMGLNNMGTLRAVPNESPCYTITA